MKEVTPIIELLNNPEEAPIELLKLADPSVTLINGYLKSGSCYVALLGAEIIGTIVLSESDSTTNEIKNIAVKESLQRKGVGKKLLAFADKLSRQKGYKNILIGTGNSSISQLLLYQKAGFEIKEVERDFFLKNYADPIFENGIQCKHKIILEKDLNT
ncbi:GNAT family N-acetyltransferase [Flagellimonas pacifica]|uniref:Aminoglycoside 6'-N-acetyltransferase I n=1 Tax=Flagellimonas pacifica TaxID=1247520 RepID=A0A285MT42_9FLAO|nr:GNAT family N-acetyltransferase [Allomuricauda parva]SNZ00352.1 aminoglycoside 6'-N-acetyltransferase I [Allomuricauda parva]